ncbi:MAG: DUF4129 domain-containing protein [Oscillospiraceae bacterium]|nr:DUF4129 domain-containing protein [Oscillospiraceae bacterium]
MNEIEKVNRRIHWNQCVHLALLNLMLAFPLTLTFQTDEQTIQILIALGTLIPVQAIRIICERIQKPGLRFLLSFAVIVLSVAVSWSNGRWSVYLLSCLPIFICGVFLPRSKGRILLTIPSFFGFLAAAVSYFFGRAVETLGVPMVGSIVLALTALMTVNFLIYTSQVRLLADIRLSCDTEVSMNAMILQNRKTVGVFLLIGVLILSAIPLLMQLRKPGSNGLEGGILPPGTTESVLKPADVFFTPGEGGDSLNLELAKNIFLWFLILFFFGTASSFIILQIIQDISGITRKRKRPNEPIISDGLLIERVDESDSKRKKEKLTGWEKKIRRRYEKLILRRTREDTLLQFMTPSEQEYAAGLSGREESVGLREIYERTRYGADSPSREDYRRFRELSKDI